MSALNAYYQLMARLFTSRRQQVAHAIEGAILDEMDLVWSRLSAEERRTADALSARIASGALTEA